MAGLCVYHWLALLFFISKGCANKMIHLWFLPLLSQFQGKILVLLSLMTPCIGSYYCDVTQSKSHAWHWWFIKIQLSLGNILPILLLPPFPHFMHLKVEFAHSCKKKQKRGHCLQRLFSSVSVPLHVRHLLFIRCSNMMIPNSDLSEKSEK